MVAEILAEEGVRETPAKRRRIESGTDDAGPSTPRQGVTTVIPMTDYKEGTGPPGVNINGAAEAAHFLKTHQGKTDQAEKIAAIFTLGEKRKLKKGKEGKVEAWKEHVKEMDAAYQNEPKEEQLEEFMKEKFKLYQKPLSYKSLLKTA